MLEFRQTIQEKRSHFYAAHSYKRAVGDAHSYKCVVGDAHCHKCVVGKVESFDQSWRRIIKKSL